MHVDVRSTNFLPRRREVFLSLFNSSLRINYTTHLIHLNAAAINNITDQTSTRKRRVFRHAILGFNARSVHRPARSHRPLRRHAKSRVTIRAVFPFTLASLDSRENALGTVSRGGRGKRRSGQSRWEYRDRRARTLNILIRRTFIHPRPLQNNSKCYENSSFISTLKTHTYYTHARTRTITKLR